MDQTIAVLSLMNESDAGLMADILKACEARAAALAAIATNPAIVADLHKAVALSRQGGQDIGRQLPSLAALDRTADALPLYWAIQCAGYFAEDANDVCARF